MTEQTKVIILDKSFIQAEGKETKRLRALRESGGVFAITDTLIYEICTGRLTTLWAAVQRKLFAFADRVLVWRHTADLLRAEIDGRQPILSPTDEALTQQTRRWFQGGQEYVPDDLAQQAQRAYRQREIDSFGSLVAMCRTFAGTVPDVWQTMIQARGRRIDLSALCCRTVGDERLVQWLIGLTHGRPDQNDTYIPGAENGLDQRWFAYHHARCTLALLCVFMSQFGMHDTPGEDFRHTGLDADYLALLHYADGLATNETSGSMADMLNWLYGKSKLAFSTGDVDAVLPSEVDVRLDAYFDWDRNGRTHGHDIDDFLTAERRGWSKVWSRLSDSSKQGADQ